MKSEKYQQVASIIESITDMEHSPVAIKLFESIDEASSILPLCEDNLKHCQFVCKAFDSKFYTTIDQHECPKGASVLGLMDMDMDVAQIDTKMEAVGYAPLGESPFMPDSILLYLKPINAFKFIKVYYNATGNRINADLAGVSAVCSESIIIPMKNNEPNISLGCTGSRISSDLADDELIISLTMDNVEKLLSSL
ncbi:MAG: DUF169 domain-containing protein [Methanosphaera sp.]|nr:DUF169 domain-containing protein [Methanosphaera sp.]